MKAISDTSVHKWFLPRRARIVQNDPLSRGSLAITPPLPRCATTSVTCTALDLPALASALIGWIDDPSERLLWIANVETWPISFLEAFVAMRRGVGELSELNTTRGHIFGVENFHADDQSDTSPEAIQEIGLLASSIILIMIGAWEGALYGKGSPEYVEFWDGHLLFYSEAENKKRAAKKIITDFNLPLAMGKP